MGTYQTKIIDNMICSKLTGELDATLASEWVEKLEQQESEATNILHRFHDVREINAIHLNFDSLWEIAQRRLETYKAAEPIMSIFWVSTPLNYGIARMYQALTDGTPFKIHVLYNLDEAATLLDVRKKSLEEITY